MNEDHPEYFFSETKDKDADYYLKQFSNFNSTKETIETILIEFVIDIEKTKTKISNRAIASNRAVHTVIINKLEPIEKAFFDSFYERDPKINIFIYFALEKVNASILDLEDNFLRDSRKVSFINRKIGNKYYTEIMSELFPLKVVTNYVNSNEHFEFNLFFRNLIAKFKKSK